MCSTKQCGCWAFDIACYDLTLIGVVLKNHIEDIVHLIMHNRFVGSSGI